MLAVNVEALSRVFAPRGGEPVRALSSVDLQVERGKVQGLLGHASGRGRLLRAQRISSVEPR